MDVVDMLVKIVLLLTCGFALLYFFGRWSREKRAHLTSFVSDKATCHFCTHFDGRKKLPPDALQPNFVYAEHTVQEMEQPVREDAETGMVPAGPPQLIGQPKTIEVVADFRDATRRKMKVLGAVTEIGYCAQHCKRVSRNATCDQFQRVL